MMDFYKTPRWKRFREYILARDSYVCQECKRYGRIRQAKEVHHIKHRDTYPDLIYDPTNCVSLCKACHNKQHPEKGDRRKFKGYEK